MKFINCKQAVGNYKRNRADKNNILSVIIPAKEPPHVTINIREIVAAYTVTAIFKSPNVGDSKNLTIYHLNNLRT